MYLCLSHDDNFERERGGATTTAASSCCVMHASQLTCRLRLTCETKSSSPIESHRNRRKQLKVHPIRNSTDRISRVQSIQTDCAYLRLNSSSPERQRPHFTRWSRCRWSWYQTAGRGSSGHLRYTRCTCRTCMHLPEAPFCESERRHRTVRNARQSKPEHDYFHLLPLPIIEPIIFCTVAAVVNTSLPTAAVT